ncbi:MAG: cadherin repeat domain-containing protein, partial [Planctomycetales bacterium]|nr:cadherin repeat domain-containing protein [Planctomycetales bacterium]
MRHRSRRSGRRRDQLKRSHTMEFLEQRLVLATTLISDELLVNDFVPRYQADTGASTAVAASSDRMVIAFEGKGPTDSDGVHAKLYGSDGQELSTAFQVNTTRVGSQEQPVVGMASDGSFVVGWSGRGPGDKQGIFLRRFDRAAVPLTGEIRAHSPTGGAQQDPAIAVSAGGNFVVAWDGTGPGDFDGVFAQRFDSGGGLAGSMQLVNSTVDGQQAFPAVAIANDGTFVVTWSSRHQDGSDWGVYGQRFAANGTRIGGEFAVNTYQLASQVHSSVSMSENDGEFVVTWSSYGQDGDSWGVFGQRFSSNGARIGSEFLVNAATQGHQLNSTVTLSESGGMLAAWSTGIPDGSGWEVHAQSLTAEGEADGDAIVVNQGNSGFASGHQSLPAIAANGTSATAAWSGNGTDDHQGVFFAALAAEGEVDTPELAAIPDQVINEETLLTFDAVGIGCTGTGVYTLGEDAPTGASINGLNGKFAWQPTEEQGPGEYAVTVHYACAADVSTRVSQTVNISVLEVNLAPTIGQVSDLEIEQDSTLVVVVTAMDPDVPANSLTFRLDEGPTGVDFNTATGELRWTPTAEQAGITHPFRVSVFDDGNPVMDDTTAFNVTVIPIVEPNLA